MTENKLYWTMKCGNKIDVDQMTESHLRNTLKLIIRRNNLVRVVEQENNEPYCDDWMWK